MAAVDEIRSFNRFYTRRIGLLDKGLSASPFPLVDARVLYELAAGPKGAAADLARALDMDKAHLSRVLARLRGRGLVIAETSPSHARRRILSLTAAGRDAFAKLEKSTVAQMREMIAPLGRPSVERLTGAMREIALILDPRAGAKKAAFSLREPRVGDLGWIVHRQARLYAEEYGWDWRFEGLIAGIVERYIANYDPSAEAAWIAERGGAIVGSVFLVRGDETKTGKLRLLYVEPSARGLGIGAALVEACIERARSCGYSRLALWTNDVLVSARRIYEAAGFKLIAEERHFSFGKDLVGQNWTLEL
ncbi:MAG TPA: helix-turn-helix domain-containing GNAT family N-acetyltransferase [Roseiarcus sp.]|nr:helix-turn-helix domain-containing GNAT family N-acetyltransferase [Roseiarcus sp.]